MNKLYYDLHIHSCLSPCGDNESTPDSIAGMGELNGLGIMALTDHNTVKNCPAFFKAAERHGVVPVAGLELTTSEDIHMVCLFETLEGALDFGTIVEKSLVRVKNREDVFGSQLIVDEFDRVIGREEDLLINATEISVGDVKSKVESFGGITYPAHIDREAGGMVAVLGSVPAEYGFRFAELHDRNRKSEYAALTGMPEDRFLISSDAHVLWNIKEAEDHITLECGSDPSEVRKALFDYLRCKK